MTYSEEAAPIATWVTKVGADADKWKAGLDAAMVDNKALSTRVLALEEMLEVTQNDLDAAKAEIKRLKDLYEPASPQTTLMGVTVTGPVYNLYNDLHDDVAVSRVYAQGTQDWSQEGQHKRFPNGKWAVSNSYALSEANLPKFLASIPAADKAKIVAYADGHELEHPDKGLKAADVKARTKRTAPVIRAAGLRVAVCMMGWSLRNEDWLLWVDPDDVDVLCWDKYNSGNKKDPPVYQDPVKMVDEMVQASQRFNKPFALWETGTNQFGGDAARVAWVKALRAEVTKQGAETAIWFDRKSTSPTSTWDASLDRPSAEAWLL